MVTSILKNAQSSFALMPQGQAVEFEGRLYQVYVTVVPVELTDPFSIDDEVTLISFNKDQLISFGNYISIADDYLHSESKWQLLYFIARKRCYRQNSDQYVGDN